MQMYVAAVKRNVYVTAQENFSVSPTHKNAPMMLNYLQQIDMESKLGLRNVK